MNDKELLEFAALAVGYTDLPIEGWTTDSTKGMRLVGADHEFVRYWNPLDDDDDALRLAVKIELDVMCGSVRTDDFSVSIPIRAGTEIYAATRYAIVRAAAEIGKSMKVD